jgi:hypothetical protein
MFPLRCPTGPNQMADFSRKGKRAELTAWVIPQWTAESGIPSSDLTDSQRNIINRLIRQLYISNL